MVSTVEHPLKDPKTAKWGRPITHSDYSKLLQGFMPQEMEQKWMVITDAPDAQGNIVVHICRSWTPSEQYSLTIAGGTPDETKAKDWATIVEVSWNKENRAYETGELINEDEVKDLVVQIHSQSMHVVHRLQHSLSKLISLLPLAVATGEKF